MAFFGLFGNDRQMAATRYAGRESARERGERKRAEQTAKRAAKHQRSGATKAARQGQAWEDASRMRERYGKRRR